MKSRNWSLHYKTRSFPKHKKTFFLWGALDWFGFTGDVSISTCIHMFATSNCWGYHVKTFPEAWYWCSTALSSVVSWNQLRRWVSCPRRFYVNVSTCVYMYIHIHTYIYIHTYFLCVSMNIRAYVRICTSLYTKVRASFCTICFKS